MVDVLAWRSKEQGWRSGQERLKEQLDSSWFYQRRGLYHRGYRNYPDHSISSPDLFPRFVALNRDTFSLPFCSISSDRPNIYAVGDSSSISKNIASFIKKRIYLSYQNSFDFHTLSRAAISSSILLATAEAEHQWEHIRYIKCQPNPSLCEPCPRHLRKLCESRSLWARSFVSAPFFMG